MDSVTLQKNFLNHIRSLAECKHPKVRLIKCQEIAHNFQEIFARFNALKMYYNVMHYLKKIENLLQLQIVSCNN